MQDNKFNDRKTNSDFNERFCSCLLYTSSIGSGGGGRPDMAQAGIKDISKADMALENAKGFIKERL